MKIRLRGLGRLGTVCPGLGWEIQTVWHGLGWEIQNPHSPPSDPLIQPKKTCRKTLISIENIRKPTGKPGFPLKA